MKALIVEDDFICRVLLQKLLAPYGECHIAVNGKEAVEAVGLALKDRHPYDLICLDILMPEMDGHAALKAIRAKEKARGILSSRGAKIVMTTALDDPKNVMSAFYELCDGYLLKPITKKKVAELMGKLKFA